MIDVTGIDGRIHSFADGTTQEQIDAALEAIYRTPAAGAHQAPPNQYSASTLPSPSGQKHLTTILGGALALAVIALLGTLALMMRDRPTQTAGQTAGQTSSAQGVTVAPADGVPTNAVVATTAGSASPTVTPETFAGFVATQQGGNVTLRVQPQTGSAQVAKLPHGAPISVTGSVVMPDGLWRQVNVGGMTGFVKGAFISQTQPAPIAQAAAPIAKMIPREFWGFATTKSSASVNVRSSPSTSSSVISSIKTGDYVYVVAEQGAWYLIEFKGKRGWTNSSYISREEPD